MNSPRDSLSLADIRTEYSGRDLLEQEVNPNPFIQFRTWLDEALLASADEMTSMTVATVTPEGRPATRVVLLKGLDETGVVFYTNYHSQKAKELDAHPVASLLFHWSEIDRQVRIDGRVEKVSAAESDAYFASRPHGSQIGAWVSPQSEVIPNRDMLDRTLRELEQQYADKPVPRPAHWGGYRVIPEMFEFWQGKPNRLHDRIRYRLEKGRWIIERLAP